MIMDSFEIKNIKASSLALGTFDGLHAGHRKVIENAADCRDGEIPLILMFCEHPMLSLKGAAPEKLITKTEETRQLKEMGICPVYIEFPSIMNLDCEDFIITVSRKYKVKQLSCGFNYRFGKNAGGDPMLLKQLCDDSGIRLKVAPAVLYGGAPVSSSRIRESLKKGDVKSARNMLGRPFSYDFTVEESRKLGRKLGFPTINQHFPYDFIIPLFGVYASFTALNGKNYPSVTNIGLRPTVGDGVMGSETHIIGIDEDLYGENVCVSLIERLRGEKKFLSLEALRNQIYADTEKAVKVWEDFNGQTD